MTSSTVSGAILKRVGIELSSLARCLPSWSNHQRLPPDVVSDSGYGRLHGMELLREADRAQAGEAFAGADVSVMDKLQLGFDIVTVVHLLLRLVKMDRTR